MSIALLYMTLNEYLIIIIITLMNVKENQYHARFSVNENPIFKTLVLILTKYLQ